MNSPELTTKVLEGGTYIMIKAGSTIEVGEADDDGFVNKTYTLTEDLCVFVEEKTFRVNSVEEQAVTTTTGDVS